MGATVFQMRAATNREDEICCSCGVEFASPVIAKRRDDGKTFYCPNGHPQSYTETEASRLAKQLKKEQQRRESAERDAAWARAESRNHLTQRTKAQNKLKRLTTRVEAGTCIHCNRTFKQLAAHMRCKHAEQIVTGSTK